MKPFFASLFLVSFACFSFAQEVNWQLTSGKGQQVPPNILEVTGDGTSTAVWQSEPDTIPMFGCYRFSVSHRGVDTNGGCLPCGIEGFTRDFSTTSNQWRDEFFYFLPNKPISDHLPLRVGQWESTGTFQFRDIKLEPVMRILRVFDLPLGKMWLGDGESISDGKYQFRSNFVGKGTNMQRPFYGGNAIFNSNRWCFSSNSSVHYGFYLATWNGILHSTWKSGKLVINVCYHTQGEGVIKIKNSSEEQLESLRITKVGTLEIDIPLPHPAREIRVEITGLDGCYFQIDRIDFEASLPETIGETNMHSLNLKGETWFAIMDKIDEDGFDPIFLELTKNNDIRVVDSNPSDTHEIKTISLETSRSPGEKEQKFEHNGIQYTLATQTHPLERSDYGYRIGDHWWCEADWKISRDRQPPDSTEPPKPITISAAKNDVEGFQFVLRADKYAPIRGLTGSVTELKGPDGAVIPAENVELLYTYYHFVHSRTDDTGLIGDWPDALPPLVHPIDIPAGKNQPIWINVKVPTDAIAGDYQGTFHLKSADGQIDLTVPYTLHVWNFALPKENHFETAYGYNPNQAAQYHNAMTDEDRRRVNEMYLQCFSDHRVSIYNPAPFDGFNVQWFPNDVLSDEGPPRCEIDFSRFDAETERVIEKFHFTNFTVPGHGLGGGTFHARAEPSIAGFAEDTPEYKAMLADYYAKLQAHLIDKGWIDKAYVYWFDEPGNHDYEFVANGTAKIQHYAPKIQRFMTLMMDNDGFMKALDEKNTSINIWCPVSNSFRDDLAKQRMEKGERFWWYVCTGPKAPYCTLFIDKPATELRVWHWQEWQRNIVGGLVWESTYWHSATAFPNSFQNPYEDPMGYTVGYSVPSGTKQHWGNGDGRFIYPPLSAAIPGRNNGAPIFEKPVSSIRWEMIREGIEDYEMLYMLRELVHQKGDKLSETDRKLANELLEVPESITKSMTDFTIDPRPILERRKAVAEMIERLMR